MEYIIAQVRENVLGTVNMLNCTKNAWETQDGFKESVKFLNVSTDEVYGSLGSGGFLVEITPLDLRSLYSSSKASSDLIVKSFYDTYKMSLNIKRCSK
ncbi:dTDP-glucose 4,6-dehydratase 2 [Clostridium puniceum]|uniref:dTDP-glucose 4,6-dehydratase 2 n=1 Tax=Clostridium puniceum TaxID=29367 RepID=A0A1S8T0H5_9CLOT|nr:dTDP-glucose 4,6-dehydratase 2 [Clostridium puniceum]